MNKNVQKNYILSKELSSLYKSIGFNDLVESYYDVSGFINEYREPENFNSFEDRISAPNSGEIVKWLNQKHGITFKVLKNGSGEKGIWVLGINCLSCYDNSKEIHNSSTNISTNSHKNLEDAQNEVLELAAKYISTKHGIKI